MGRVESKVAIVTGGGSGLGAASSELLASEGARVIVTDINGDAAEQTAAVIRQRGQEAVALTHNVSDEVQWQDVVAKAMQTYGRLDVLVNNAGISGVGSGDWEETSLEDWQRVISINLDGVFLGCREVIKVMKAEGGSIINISSIMGIVGGAGAAYNASKGAVRLLTKSITSYCGRSGYPIRTNSVHPGYIWTPLVRNVVDYVDDVNNEDELRAMLTEMHPIGRLGVPEDIANGVLFLASDESAFMTGSELVIDGGYTAV